MADKSFGVKELNLLNASGTPTVTSPNNLNLNANTVAISTSCTIGNNLTVTSTTTSANVNVTGIATVVNFNATGISTIAQPSNTNAHSAWLVTANGTSAYRFTGPGQDGSDDDPDVYLVRGQRYIFTNNSGGSHPFQIRVASGGAAYSTGVTNNGASSGNIIFNVQHDAPAQLFYQCTSHSGMVGNIYIVGGPQVISGVVTATTFVGNLTGNVTGTASANAVLTGSTNDQLVTVTGANAITGESALTYSGNILKNEVSDASGLTAHILVNNSESSAGVSLLGSGSSFSSGGWAPVTDAGIIRSSANASNGLVLQAASGDMRFYVAGSPTERLSIDSNGLLTATGSADFNVAGGEFDIYSTGSGDQLSLRLLNSDASAGNKIGIYFGPANNVAGAYIKGVAESDFTSTANRDAGLEFGTRLNATFLAPLKISASGIVTKPSYHPCFRAGRSSDITPGSQGTIVFNYVANPTHFNQGGHYDNSTGAFTAPVAGIYNFYCQVLWEGLSSGQNMDDAFYVMYNSSGGASGGTLVSYDARLSLIHI